MSAYNARAAVLCEASPWDGSVYVINLAPYASAAQGAVFQLAVTP